MLTLSYLGLALDALHVFGFEGGRDQHPDGGIPAQRSCPGQAIAWDAGTAHWLVLLMSALAPCQVK